MYHFIDRRSGCVDDFQPDFAVKWAYLPIWSAFQEILIINSNCYIKKVLKTGNHFVNKTKMVNVFITSKIGELKAN